MIQASTDKKWSHKTVDSFVNFLSRLGVSSVRKDNTVSHGHYEFNLLTRNRLQLEAAYRGSWMVGRIIDSMADDMTRAGITITTNEGAHNIEKMKAAMSRLQIWQSLNFEIKCGRLYGGALGVMQIKGQKLDTPLDLDTVGKDQFKGISVYDRWQLNPDLTDLIEEGPEMGLPKYYDIVSGRQYNNSEPVLVNPTGKIRVHHSRCIRMIGIELPYFQAITEMMWGESILERVYDRLISFDTTTMSAANLVDRAYLRTVGVDGLREVIAQGGPAYEGLLQFFEMMREFQTNQGLTLLDKNDVFQTTSYTFAGLPEVLLQFAQQVTGAAESNLTVLFGQSPSGLNATGEADLRMYYDSINAKQESRLRNPVEMILQVLHRSLFGIPAPEDLQFTFNHLLQLSQIDKANIAKTKTDTVIAAHQENAISTPTMMKELRSISGEYGVFSNITDEEIQEAEHDEPPMPDQAVPEDPNATSAAAKKPDLTPEKKEPSVEAQA